MEHLLPNDLRILIALLLISWREGRHASRSCRELLAMYRTASTEHPELDHRELYKLVIMARNGCDAAAANVILKRAEESFAAWPVMSELSLSDVVHYLTVCELLGARNGEHWIHSDINHVVITRIPDNL